MVTIQKKGDLFTCGADAITNTVNCVGVMGAGIAKEFKLRYPEMFVEYVHQCKKGLLYPGKVWVWCESLGTTKPNYIVNFPTKDDWRHRSQLSWIVSGLADLRKHVIMSQIASLAMPALGCNLGGLDFVDVRKAVEDSLGDLDLAVTLFEPR